MHFRNCLNPFCYTPFHLFFMCTSPPFVFARFVWSAQTGERANRRPAAGPALKWLEFLWAGPNGPRGRNLLIIDQLNCVCVFLFFQVRLSSSVNSWCLLLPSTRSLDVRLGRLPSHPMVPTLLGLRGIALSSSFPGQNAWRTCEYHHHHFL